MTEATKEKLPELKNISDILKNPSIINSRIYPSGFRRLDECLDGGFKPGLSFLAGFAASGKSAMISQIALQMSEQDIPVIYFSLEMAERECVSRMLSFVSYRYRGDNAYTANKLLNNSEGKYSETNPEYREIIEKTEEATKNIYLTTSQGTVLTPGIVDKTIEEFNVAHPDKEKPAVIIDCLHMLRIENDEYLQEDQRISIVLKRLKAISDKYDIPIICTTWVSRSHYDQPVSLKSIKQANYVALYANTILGLQCSGSGDKWFDFISATSKRPRKMDLIILKNKNAMVGQAIKYEFDLMYNTIEED